MLRDPVSVDERTKFLVDIIRKLPVNGQKREPTWRGTLCWSAKAEAIRSFSAVYRRGWLWLIKDSPHCHAKGVSGKQLPAFE